MWVWKMEVVGENGQVGDDNICKRAKKKKKTASFPMVPPCQGKLKQRIVLWIYLLNKLHLNLNPTQI